MKTKIRDYKNGKETIRSKKKKMKNPLQEFLYKTGKTTYKKKLNN